MEVFIQHLGAVQFEIKARQHTMICDQPAENNGYDEGMTPPELLLASLGTCAAYYAVDYLNRNKLSPEGTKVRVTAEKVKGPFRLDDFKIEVDVPGELERPAFERPRGSGASLSYPRHANAPAANRGRDQGRGSCLEFDCYFVLIFSRSFAASSGRTGSVMRAGSRISLIWASVSSPRSRAISMIDFPVFTDSLAISAALA